MVVLMTAYKYLFYLIGTFLFSQALLPASAMPDRDSDITPPLSDLSTLLFVDMGDEQHVKEGAKAVVKKTERKTEQKAGVMTGCEIDAPLSVDIRTEWLEFDKSGMGEEQYVEEQCKRAEAVINTIDQDPEHKVAWLQKFGKIQLKRFEKLGHFILWMVFDHLMPDKSHASAERQVPKIAQARQYLASVRKESADSGERKREDSPYLSQFMDESRVLMTACTKGDLAEVKNACTGVQYQDIAEALVDYACTPEVVEFLLTKRGPLTKSHVPTCLAVAASLGNCDVVDHLLKHHCDQVSDAYINKLGTTIIKKHNKAKEIKSSNGTDAVCAPLFKVVHALKAESDARRIKREAVDDCVLVLPHDEKHLEHLNRFGIYVFGLIIDLKPDGLTACQYIAEQIRRADMLIKCYAILHTHEDFDEKMLLQCMHSAIKQKHFILADILFFLTVRPPTANKHLATIYKRYKYFVSLNQQDVRSGFSDDAADMRASQVLAQPCGLLTSKVINPKQELSAHESGMRKRITLIKTLPERDQTTMYLTCGSLFMNLLSLYTNKPWIHDMMHFFMLLNPEVLWTVDEHGNTALHLAAMANNIELAKLFLEYGKTIKFDMTRHYNKKNQLPIMYAMAKEQRVLFHTLLGGGDE